MREDAERAAVPGGVTRSRMLRGLAGGALVAGGVAVGARRGAESVQAAGSHGMDTRIVSFFLQLEQIQVAFYDAALEARKLDGELLDLALAVREQERRHAAFFAGWLKDSAAVAPRTNFGDKLESAESFRDAAIELEEAAIAGYIGQAAHLTAETMGLVATLVSVEARQAAWLRDIAGISPAPKAADPPRKAADVMAFLRDKGYLE